MSHMTPFPRGVERGRKDKRKRKGRDTMARDDMKRKGSKDISHRLHILLRLDATVCIWHEQWTDEESIPAYEQ